MKKLKLIKSAYDELSIGNKDIVLHESILDILFKQKGEIHRKLIDLRGTFLIDHVAIHIIDPNKRLVVFSITPSVEYNLIMQGLWRFDQSFSDSYQKSNSFYAWENAYLKDYYERIKFLKEKKHGFTYGFSVSKKVEEFTFVYSYATRSKNNELEEYYRAHLSELITLGDYGYKLVREIYQHYCYPIEPPSLTSLEKKPPMVNLKLIINNKA